MSTLGDPKPISFGSVLQQEQLQIQSLQVLSGLT